MADDRERWRSDDDRYRFGEERDRFRGGHGRQNEEYGRFGRGMEHGRDWDRDYGRETGGRDFGGRDYWGRGGEDFGRREDYGRREEYGRREGRGYQPEQGYGSGYGARGSGWTGGGGSFSGEGYQRRGVYDRDFGREGYGRESFGREGYGREYGPDRGWWDRATDEVSSWFGDEDAERRRREDERRDYHRGRGPRGYTRSDERIREDVNDRLTDHPVLNASDIEVSVSGGEVTLSGMVDSRYDKRLAEDIVERISGVTHVQNNLRVRSSAQRGTSFGNTGEFGSSSSSMSPASSSQAGSSQTGSSQTGTTGSTVAGSGLGSTTPVTGTTASGASKLSSGPA
jgi:osmotically-inducible protein OsmY